MNVKQEQHRVFPASVVYWIAESKFVHDFEQGNGYGKSAMKELINLMRQNGCKRVMIGHRPDNLIAGNLYESLGFQKISEVDGEIIRFLQL